MTSPSLVKSFYFSYSDVPESFYLSSLHESDADKVNDSWAYSDKCSKAFIKCLIRNYATIAIRTADSCLIAHMLERENGSLGMLYVASKYRSKGLGKLAVSELSHKIKQFRDTVHVYATNEASLRVHTRCGFRKIANALVYEFHPQ